MDTPAAPAPVQQQALQAVLPTLPGRTAVLTYNLDARQVMLRVTTSNMEAGVLDTSASVTLTHGEAAALLSALVALLAEVGKRRAAQVQAAVQAQDTVERVGLPPAAHGGQA